MKTPFFCHDALPLARSAETKAWMEEEGMSKCWMLPAKGLNANALRSNHPPRNSPELMPLSNDLLEDWTDRLCAHQLRAVNLPEDDPGKFSEETSNRLSSLTRRA